ncbi:MAG: dihydrofolate reductase family protein [Taibaiella sp.]|nr:dihydrofolate reductase family protein [Taibaiella sp.]
MRKIIAAINMTLDGYCDHTAINPDAAIHDHYSELLKSAGTILYGSITFKLMQYWQDLLRQPSGVPSMDDFAASIDQIPKIVFSHKLQDTGWDTATLAQQSLEATTIALKQQPGKPVLVGSPGLIRQLMQLNLIDEYQICVHPVVAGGGKPLFENVDRTLFKLVNTKTFASGAVILYYEEVSTKPG